MRDNSEKQEMLVRIPMIESFILGFCFALGASLEALFVLLFWAYVLKNVALP